MHIIVCIKQVPNPETAFSMFRIAGILQGIMKRVVDGTASSAQALDAGKRARPMAEMGWEYAKKAGA